MEHSGTYESPFGPIGFLIEDGALVHMAFGERRHDDKTPDVLKVCRALESYFKKESTVFGLDVRFKTGTPFQKSVWNALLRIPYGKTVSYQGLARMIGRDSATRAVGQACKRNPVGLVVPCHRVIGKDGSMTGYSGKDHVDLKRKLIDFESSENN
jgi:O-6-methylguanine DNA methyltransferase